MKIILIFLLSLILALFNTRKEEYVEYKIYDEEVISSLDNRSNKELLNILNIKYLDKDTEDEILKTLINKEVVVDENSYYFFKNKFKDKYTLNKTSNYKDLILLNMSSRYDKDDKYRDEIISQRLFLTDGKNRINDIHTYTSSENIIKTLEKDNKIYVFCVVTGPSKVYLNTEIYRIDNGKIDRLDNILDRYKVEYNNDKIYRIYIDGNLVEINIDDEIIEKMIEKNILEKNASKNIDPDFQTKRIIEIVEDKIIVKDLIYYDSRAILYNDLSISKLISIYKVDNGAIKLIGINKK